MKPFRFPLKLSEKADTKREISLPGKKRALADKNYRYSAGRFN